MQTISPRTEFFVPDCSTFFELARGCEESAARLRTSP
jgi:hypothetical protein